MRAAEQQPQTARPHVLDAGCLSRTADAVLRWLDMDKQHSRVRQRTSAARRLSAAELQHLHGRQQPFMYYLPMDRNEAQCCPSMPFLSAHFPWQQPRPHVIIQLPAFLWQHLIPALTSAATHPGDFPEAGATGPVDLPAPEMAQLPEIARALREVSPFQRDRVAEQLMRPGYLRRLLDLFRVSCRRRRRQQLQQQQWTWLCCLVWHQRSLRWQASAAAWFHRRAPVLQKSEDGSGQTDNRLESRSVMVAEIKKT